MHLPTSLRGAKRRGNLQHQSATPTSLRGVPPHVIARSEATWQSATLFSTITILKDCHSPDGLRNDVRSVGLRNDVRAPDTKPHFLSLVPWPQRGPSTQTPKDDTRIQIRYRLLLYTEISAYSLLSSAYRWAGGMGFGMPSGFGFQV